MSYDPDAKYSPTGENATMITQLECPVRIFIGSPLDKLHTFIVQSLDPDAKYSPFGENTMLITQLECPVRILMRSPFDTLHRLIVEY